jgi:hypothetical protein
VTRLRLGSQSVEIEGGLYDIITRGNNRQLVFDSDDDDLKLLLLLAQQKASPGVPQLKTGLEEMEEDKKNFRMAGLAPSETTQNRIRTNL